MDMREFSSVRRWLLRARYDDPDRNLRSFERFVEWLGETDLASLELDPSLSGLSPDELLEHQRENGDYGVLDAVQMYVSGLIGRASYKRLVYSRLRSFFAHNRLALPEDVDFEIDGDEPPVVGRLKVGEIKRVLDSCNECYRAYFLCMFQGGMGLNEMEYWNLNGWPSLQEQLSRGVHPVRVDIPVGRKKGRNKKPFYTFIGNDAIDALRVWLRIRPRGARAIFTNQFGRPVNKRQARTYWTWHLVRLGIIERPEDAGTSTRYGKNPHKIRGKFKSRWRPSGADTEVADFLMGHDIDKLNYDESPWDNPGWFEEQYMIAEPWLNIVSQDPEKVPVRDYNRIKWMYEKKLADLKQEILAEVLRAQEELRRVPAP